LFLPLSEAASNEMEGVLRRHVKAANVAAGEEFMKDADFRMEGILHRRSVEKMSNQTPVVDISVTLSTVSFFPHFYCLTSPLTDETR
ncbi:hypothetical protein PMAYCL1PPCAC_21339, partial [Pristionchus mayeri]